MPPLRPLARGGQRRNLGAPLGLHLGLHLGGIIIDEALKISRNAPPGFVRFYEAVADISIGV